MDGAAVAHGQWWRLFTAIWLHADLAHLATNATIGLLLLGLAMGRYGTGAGLLAAYLAGAGGNLVAGLISLQPHRSLGASGMVIGCLGSASGAIVFTLAANAPCHEIHSQRHLRRRDVIRPARIDAGNRRHGASGRIRERAAAGSPAEASSQRLRKCRRLTSLAACCLPSSSSCPGGWPCAVAPGEQTASLAWGAWRAHLDTAAIAESPQAGAPTCSRLRMLVGPEGSRGPSVTQSRLQVGAPAAVSRCAPRGGHAQRSLSRGASHLNAGHA